VHAGQTTNGPQTRPIVPLDASYLRLKQRISELAALPDDQAEAAWQTLTAEQAASQ
jgi:hypothetical protein